MSLSIDVDVPGLTAEEAAALDRRADLVGAPFTIAAPRRLAPSRTTRLARVEMTDLRDDPSIASETLDHPEGWPQDPSVRQWLEAAIEFLAMNLPGLRFTFHAGWPEQRATTTTAVGIEAFRALIRSGRLHTDQQYDVQVGR